MGADEGKRGEEVEEEEEEVEERARTVSDTWSGRTESTRKKWAGKDDEESTCGVWSRFHEALYASPGSTFCRPYSVRE